MLALDGRPRGEAASLNGMDRQTLCDWVRRYNEGGVDGLKTRKNPGQAPRLTNEQKAELYDLVVKGPDPVINKVVRWRCVDLRAEVARPRPVHSKKDVEAETTFKKIRQPGARDRRRRRG